MIGTVLNGRFALESELGRGGMGAVYHAVDQVLGRPVAIKVLKELTGAEVGARIRMEAQITARLLHDNVVRLYDFGTADGLYFLVMEEVDGTSLQRRWRQLALADRLRVLAQVADALDYAHRQGVIHRDIKPANVLLTAADQPKLSDFGLSLLEQDAEEAGITRGTPSYMSPEQAQGKRLDARSDLYALGIMLYECATGTVPFAGAPMTVMMHQVRTPPDPPHERNPNIHPALEALILRLLAKEPEARPASGAEVAQALRDLIPVVTARGDLETAAHPAVPPPTLAATSTAAPYPSPGPVPAPAPALLHASPPLVRELIGAVEATPIPLSPEERYLTGHYLAYLLGGSRRRGIFLRRPLDPLNADRARLLLAMTAAMLGGGTEEAIARSARLLEERPDVRPALSPVVVLKYLASRASPADRKRFRRVRQRLLELSPYAQAHLTDAGGALNPGLMPQALDDLRKIAPARTELDDRLIERWNRVADVWRERPDFRAAVLRYATARAAHDPASAGLWPEVVYPLIERARWQRLHRTGAEALLDAVCGKVLHLPDAGVQLDRAIERAVPERVVEKLDLSLAALRDEEDVEEAPADEAERAADLIASASHDGLTAASLQDLEAAPAARAGVPLAAPDPIRLTQGELHSLYKEALASMRTPGAAEKHRPVPIGPYRLTVVPSVRGRSAGQVVIQGLTATKQIEVLTPSLRLAGSAARPLVAVWVYKDNSLAIAHLDFKSQPSYILWDASIRQQQNFDDPAALTHELLARGLEAPDQLTAALSKRFRPRDAV